MCCAYFAAVDKPEIKSVVVKIGGCADNISAYDFAYRGGIFDIKSFALGIAVNGIEQMTNST
jgi:hypothetical protein